MSTPSPLLSQTVSRDGTQRSLRSHSILSSAGVHVFELNVMQLVLCSLPPHPFESFSFTSLTWVTNTLFTERGSSAGLYWLSDTSRVITDSCQIKWCPSIYVALRDVKCFSSNLEVTYNSHGYKWWQIHVSWQNFVRLYFRARKIARVHLKCVVISSLLPLQRTASINFAKQPLCFHIQKGNCFSQTKGVYFSRSLWKPNSRSKYRCHPRS